MEIDDHNDITGGQPNGLTVWLTDEDLQQIQSGEFVKSKNEERGILIIVGKNNNNNNDTS
jgi:hypothetical protein